MKDEFKPDLQVRIISPKGIILSSKAFWVSSKNNQGSFDILPFHANFITFIENSPVTVKKADNQTETFNFIFAIIHNLNNNVNIYTELTHPIRIAKA